MTTPERSRVGARRAGDRRDREGLRGHRLAGPVRAGRRAQPIIEKIAAEAKRIWNLPEVKKNLLDVGADSALSDSPDAFTAFTRAERVKWAAVVKAAGVKIN